MDERLEAELADLRAMFDHPGWTALKRHTQERMDAFRSGFPFNVEDERQLYFTRGVMATLAEILHMDAPPANDDEADPQGDLYNPQQDLPV